MNYRGQQPHWAKIDKFICTLRFSKLAAFVVPKLMKEFSLTAPEAVAAWKAHQERVKA